MRRMVILDDISSEDEKSLIKNRFVVEKYDAFSTVKVQNNDFGLGDETIRVLKTMPKWKPVRF